MFIHLHFLTVLAEINAAATIGALAYSSHFDLKKTYFLIAGIAGINPKIGTIGVSPDLDILFHTNSNSP